jgi:four helix bundle protein
MHDHEKLVVFHKADGLAGDVYQTIKHLSREERFGLHSQIRRAALSVPTNIVEGSARASRSEYRRFMEIALGSSRECRYLLGFAIRVGHLPPDTATLVQQYDDLCAMLGAMVRHLRSAPPDH